MKRKRKFDIDMRPYSCLFEGTVGNGYCVNLRHTSLDCMSSFAHETEMWNKIFFRNFTY